MNKKGPSIKVINRALDKLKAQFDAQGWKMKVNHLKPIKRKRAKRGHNK